MASPLVQALAFQNAVSPAQGGIAPTDVVSAYKLASDIAEKNYQAQLAKNNAMWGGLAGIGGAGITAFGPSLAKKLFGAGANTAAGASVPASVSAAAGDGAISPGNLADVMPGNVASAAPSFGVDALGGGAGTGSVAADMGLDAAAPAAGSVATDLAAAAPAAGAADIGTEAAAAAIPDWLASVLPFLALA